MHIGLGPLFPPPSIACHVNWRLLRVTNAENLPTTAAHNLSILREMSLKAPRSETSKGILRSKRKRVALAPSLRLGLLLALQA